MLREVIAFLNGLRRGKVAFGWFVSLVVLFPGKLDWQMIQYFGCIQLMFEFGYSINKKLSSPRDTRRALNE